MLLYFQAKLDELRLTYYEFFETAYQWRFGKLVMLDDDYAQFRLHAVLPKYVTEYLRYLQEQESGNYRLFNMPEERRNLTGGKVLPTTHGET